MAAGAQYDPVPMPNEMDEQVENLWLDVSGYASLAQLPAV